jgi:urease accessory protein
VSTFSGHLHLRAAVRADGRTVLAGQSFRAPYHLSKPYWNDETRSLMVQVVNPTAGILEGDFLESQVAVETGAALLVTTPSASRVFRMRQGTAECRQHFAVAKDGWLEVLPEPLVPHGGCSYRQSTRIEVAVGGELFFADLLFPGRVGYGEAWAWDRLCLETEVWRADELILRERFDQGGAELKALAELSGSGEQACFGNCVLVAGGSAAWLPTIAALHRDGVWLGVSTLRAQAGWSIKFVARDSIRLRETLKALRETLGVSYPRMKSDPRKL